MTARASAFVVAALAACACTSHRDRPLVGVETRTTVLLADLSNQTADTLFDRGLPDAAAVALRQSARVRVHSRARLAETYRLMRIADPRTPLTYELAQDVAAREGVSFVLGLSVTRSGGEYLMGARVADVARQATVAELSERFATPDRAVEALDRLLRRTRRLFGESAGALAAAPAPLPRVVTASLGALRSYSDGSRAWIQGRYHEARDHWARAIALDTGFAMAHGALGGYHYYFSNGEEGERHYREAFARSARLTDWERLRLMTTYLSYTGRADSSIALAGLMAQRYPRVESWYDYGTALMQAGRASEAVLALERALELDSTFANAWINLASVHKEQRRWDRAVHAYRQAERLDSSIVYSNYLNNEYGGALLHDGRPDEAERLFRRMAQSPELGNRQFGQRSLGHLALWRGRLDDAVASYQEAIEITHQQGDALSEGRSRLFLAAVLRALNRVDAAHAELTAVLGLARQPRFDAGFMGPVAYELRQLERWRDLDTLVALAAARARPDNPSHGNTTALAAALAQLGRRQPDSALVSLRRLRDYSWPVYEHLARAEAFAMAGQRDSALASLEALEATSAFGREGLAEWMRAPLLIGDELARRGDAAGAMRAYERMLARWGNAAVPDVAAARARLTALRGGR
ncbi:MAG TPA: tetratricopeptide repeat protein [Gemmatimonadaceae bacterium]|nr:tetratricopeptide repeat protein [Gemmatimonadaceae bacterium]